MSFTRDFYEDLKALHDKQREKIQGKQPTVDVLWVKKHLQELQEMISSVGKSIGEK